MSIRLAGDGGLHSGSRTVVDGAGLPFPWAKRLRSTALLPVRGKRRARPAVRRVQDTERVCRRGAELRRGGGERAVHRAAAHRQREPPPTSPSSTTLTGLANRTLLADRFSQIIVQAKRRDVPLATLFIDLDGFKTVNDTLGHAGGDEL